ncbi:hypothetical protein [Micromonospora sp. NPDC049171]|uniref:hypothetical protein n=1 Tax=Micromonospora sp. NPDC049171 TaxID=3155770 RepID=UPI0033E402A5
MSRKKLAVVAGAVILALGLLGGWRWWPFGDDEVVPSCSDLAAALPDVVEGSWTLTRTEPKREADRSRVRCELDFTSADRSYQGRVVLSVIESNDEAFLRSTATTGPCDGDQVPNPSAARYEVARACSTKINDKVYAGVFLASDKRYAHILADFSNAGSTVEQLVTYANTSAQRITDRAMTLKATD